MPRTAPPPPRPGDDDINKRLDRLGYDLGAILSKIKLSGPASLTGAERTLVADLSLMAYRFPNSNAGTFLHQLKVVCLEHTFKKDTDPRSGMDGGRY